MSESSLSAIELLVQEMFDLVIDDLPFEELARLSTCSKRMCARLAPVLFATEEQRSRTMKWACENGLDSLVRIAISYGADINTVSLPDPGRTGLPFTTLTLHLAAKHRRIETFSLLLQLGAQVGETQAKSGTNLALVKQLCQPAHHVALLEPFLRAGLINQLSQELRNYTLLQALGPHKGKEPEHANLPSLKVVRMLLDSGANPNYVLRHAQTKTQTISPLSAAILSRRWDLFDLLLERGADINNVHTTKPVEPYPRGLPLRVPILAAVAAMATGTDGRVCVDQVDRCLLAGADINLAVLYVPFEAGMCLVTPLTVYLEKVEIWKDNGEGGDGQDATWGLQYLLDNGALPNPAQDIPPAYSDVMTLGHTSIRLRGVPVDVLPPTWQLLLNKWSARHLATSGRFATAVKLMIQRGDLGKEVGRVLAKYDSNLPSEPNILDAWQDLLTAVIAAAAGKFQGNIDGLLYHYMAAKGDIPKKVNDAVRGTVLRLIDAGADINAPCPGCRFDKALFRLCKRYSGADRHRNFGLTDYNYPMTRNAVEFLRFFVETARANPRIKGTYHGKDGVVDCTPAELLRAQREHLYPREQPLADEMIALLDDHVTALEESGQNSSAV